MFRGGPRGTPGQYGGVRSRVCKGTLDPVWKREWVEVRLQGGTMSSDGESDNLRPSPSPNPSPKP